jgi:hypothetical protein
MPLRAQHSELVLRGGERGAAPGDPCFRLTGIGFRLLEALVAGEIRRQQRAVALVVLLCSGRIGLGGIQGRLRLFDQRPLQVEPASIGQDHRFLGGDCRLGLGNLGGEVAIVDDEQHRALGDLLVVGGPHLLDVAFDFRADQRDVALDIGIVGRLQKAQDVPPVPAAARAQGERCDRQDYE